MKRVWVVDDNIPIQMVFGTGRPPTRLEREVIELLLRHQPEQEWDEPVLRGLCTALCVDEFEACFFTSPEAMKHHLLHGAIPPDAVIFDWEGPGFGAEVNTVVLRELLTRTAAYVQVYTHLPEESVEPTLQGLRDGFGKRILKTRTKAEVTPVDLRELVRGEWQGTIAGEIADSVRDHVRVAVERTLAEMCTMPQAGIAAVVQQRPENLLSLILAKVRDELGADALDVLTEIAAATGSAESSEALRRLLSAWYYFFPTDDRVRRGDLVEATASDGTLRLVVTPACDLAQFRKKTGGKLTVLRAVPLNEKGRADLKGAGMLPTSVGHSITAPVENVSDMLLPLPNVPAGPADREHLEDYMILCHSWETVDIPPKADSNPKAPLAYDDTPGLRRRCTLAEPFVGAAIAKISAVMFSPGVPNVPEGERSRLKAKLALK